MLHSIMCAEGPTPTHPQALKCDRSRLRVELFVLLLFASGDLWWWGVGAVPGGEGRLGKAGWVGGRSLAAPVRQGQQRLNMPWPISR